MRCIFLDVKIDMCVILDVKIVGSISKQEHIKLRMNTYKNGLFLLGERESSRQFQNTDEIPWRLLIRIMFSPRDKNPRDLPIIVSQNKTKTKDTNK